MVDAPLDQRVLDPSCGSGTFIETAVNRILIMPGKLSATEKLRKLQENVVGIDIHPVAVQLAKATWVMAAAKTIRAARKENPDSGTVSAPSTWVTPMQLRYDTGTLTASNPSSWKPGKHYPANQAQSPSASPRNWPGNRPRLTNSYPKWPPTSTKDRIPNVWPTTTR